jgi:preprotein translocase subunit SecD
MTTSVKQGSHAAISPELARRNVKMALIHLAIALGFLAAFVWSVSHR